MRHKWFPPRNFSHEKQDALFNAWNWLHTTATLNCYGPGHDSPHPNAREIARTARALVHTFGVRYSEAGKFRAPFRAGIE